MRVVPLLIVCPALLLPALAPAAPPPGAAGSGSGAPVEVEIFEGVTPGAELEAPGKAPADSYRERAFGFVRIPTKYSPDALPLDRSNPFVLRASATLQLRPGTYEFRLRARGLARLALDDVALLTTRPQRPNTDGNDPVPPPPGTARSPLRPPPYPHQDLTATVRVDGLPHRFTLVAVLGGKGLAPTPGELSVSYGKPGEIPRLLGGEGTPRLVDAEWENYVLAARERGARRDAEIRRALSAPVAAAWAERHIRIAGWVHSQPAPAAAVEGESAGSDVDRWIDAGLAAAGVRPLPPVSDLEFFRRLALDTLGVIPTPAEIRRFLRDPPAQRRGLAVDRFLADPRWADHWMGYWQDVLAENPGILKPDLNNTGPFRWWLHQCLADGIPFDRFAAELVQMNGSRLLGGPAGFGQATLNDAPMAAKADIVAQAFLAENMSCARCHDAPRHPFKQRDLFSLAAMLAEKPVVLPASSTVPIVEGRRRPLVQISMRAGEAVPPAWPFSGLVDHTAFPLPGAAGRESTRRHLAELLIAPENARFAEVLVNRLWARYMGRGLVEPLDDWSQATPSHPELLRALAREFVLGGYDLKHVARLVLNSRAYQRRPLTAGSPVSLQAERLYAGPSRRRMSAEQLVDSLVVCTGKRLDSEPLNLNPAGDRPFEQFIDLGSPCRAWQFTALSNERDRPSLALPMAQSVVDVLSTFGWRASRQNAVTRRDEAPSAMQTLVLANGIMGTRMARLSDDSLFTELCLQAKSSPGLVDDLFLRVLSRHPTAVEQRTFVTYLGRTFAGRRVAGAPRQVASLRSDPRVSWSNHLSAEATVIRMSEERRLRQGDAPTRRLTPEFRRRFEDELWALINSPEFVLVP